jgi:hypothetical protein
MEQLTLWSAGLPASPSPSQAREKAWKVNLDSSGSIFDFWKRCSQDGLFGKMCQERFLPTAEMISDSSSINGINAGITSPFESLMLNSSEWPSDAAVCSLSDTLETGSIPPRYFLSPKACAGILRRAEKRGKQIPEALRLALIRQADMEDIN